MVGGGGGGGSDKGEAGGTVGKRDQVMGMRRPEDD